MIVRQRNETVNLENSLSIHEFNEGERYWIVTDYFHYIAGHNRVRQTLNDLRSRFWVVRRRKHLKKVIKNATFVEDMKVNSIHHLLLHHYLNIVCRRHHL